MDKQLCEAQLYTMTNDIRKKQERLLEYLEAHGAKINKFNLIMPQARLIRLCMDKIEKASRCR